MLSTFPKAVWHPAQAPYHYFLLEFLHFIIATQVIPLFFLAGKLRCEPPLLTLTRNGLIREALNSSQNNYNGLHY